MIRGEDRITSYNVCYTKLLRFGAALVASEPLVGDDAEAHRYEHAVEVELPLLQALRSDVRIVPLVLAFDEWDPCRALGDSLARVVRRWSEPVLLLASSDLNHYEPAFVGVITSYSIHYTKLYDTCGTGLGMAYAANRYPGVRAAVAWNAEIAALSRRHNDANVLVLPSRFVSEDDRNNFV